MAQEEIQKPAASTPAAPSLTPEIPAPVKEVPVSAPEVTATTEEKVNPVPEPEVEVTATKEEETSTGKVMLQTESFKEESYVATELPEAEKKALDEFKEMVREALNKREFTAPPPPPPVKEEETPPVIETKTEDKPADPVTTETKPEEKPTGSEPAAPVKEEKATVPKPAAPVSTETKTEEKVTTPAPAAPVVTETKKEEKPATPTPAVPVVTETKKEEKAPAAPVVTETKKEEKAPAAPVVTETKKEEKSPAAPVVTETKKEEEKSIAPAPAPEAVVTIEKAFAAEEGTKTVEAIEESIVSVTVPEPAASEPLEPEEISIWGIPLLEDDRSDVVLLKFLRARDFKVKEAFTMLKNTVQWRKENNIDELLEENLEGSEFEKMVFTHGVDKQGHTVIYSSYGEFQNKEIFSDKEKLNKFLKWRIQFQEKCVRALDFSPDAKSSFIFVSDFRNAPGLGKRALWQFIRRAVKQFEDNYPEFVAKELFINVPWWYIPYYKTFGTIITSPRTRSKMVLAGPSKSADTIFKYVAPEVVPVKYGGLSKESPSTAEDGVTEAIVKSAAKYTIDLPASEGSTVTWELRVGTDVTYGAQFEPSNEASYTVIVSKERKIGLSDEPVITGSFKANEAGKVVITIDNQTYKKKKVLYRFKTQP